MSILASHGYALPARATPPVTAAIQHAAMWAIGAGGAIVLIEPSPYEIATLAGLIIFFATGLRLRPVFLPLIFLLVVMNLGYTISSAHLMDQKENINWV